MKCYISPAKNFEKRWPKNMATLAVPTANGQTTLYKIYILNLSSRLRPRPRLRLSQNTPRIINHSYPKQQPQTQNTQPTGNTSNSKVPKEEIF